MRNRNVSIQAGPAVPGRALARHGKGPAGPSLACVVAWAALVVASLALGCALALAVALAQGKFSQPVYVPAPVVFCPAGQHVTGVSASGWPDCAADH